MPICSTLIPRIPINVIPILLIHPILFYFTLYVLSCMLPFVVHLSDSDDVTSSNRSRCRYVHYNTLKWQSSTLIALACYATLYWHA